MDLYYALVVFFIEVCILLEVTGGALSSNNLKQQLSNCYAGRLTQRSSACHWRGLRSHYLSQSYYYLCLVPGLPPVFCRCPYNLVFEESVQTCVPGYIKGTHSAALLHSYRTKWSNRYSHRQTTNYVAGQYRDHTRDLEENHVAVMPWPEGRKRHRRATVIDPHNVRSIGDQPLNTLLSRSRNNEQMELQLHQLSNIHPDRKKTLFENGNDVDFNTISDSQGSELSRDGIDGNGYVADPAKRQSEKSEKIFDTAGQEDKIRDTFPVWAIALAALCFVILLMLIVLYLY